MGGGGWGLHRGPHAFRHSLGDRQVPVREHAVSLGVWGGSGEVGGAWRDVGGPWRDVGGVRRNRGEVLIASKRLGGYIEEPVA